MMLTMVKGDTKQWYFDCWVGKDPYVVDGLQLWFTAKEFYSDADSAAKIALRSEGAGATVTGTKTGPFEIFVSHRKLVVKVNGGGSQTITLDDGSAETISDIVTQINDVAVGFTASETSGKLTLTEDTAAEDTTLELVSDVNSVYFTLGLTAGIYGGGGGGLLVLTHPKTGVKNRILATVSPDDTTGFPFKGMDLFCDLQVKDLSDRVYTMLQVPLRVGPEVQIASS